MLFHVIHVIHNLFITSSQSIVTKKTTCVRPCLNLGPSVDQVKSLFFFFLQWANLDIQAKKKKRPGKGACVQLTVAFMENVAGR